MKRKTATSRSTKKRAQPKQPATLTALPVTSQLSTLRAWLEFAEEIYEQAGLALGQIATTAHDEALYLLLRTLDWPLDSDASVLDAPISPAQRIALRAMLQRRVIEHTPAAYITREAFLGERQYYVDERVLIPRSYFLEIIPEQLDYWLPNPSKVKRVVDVCTGSGCLAIELACHFPKATVDAIDLSPDALEVAKINVRGHLLTRRVKLHQSDVFDSVPVAKYDVILSNPPYEPSRICDGLPAEFLKEPRLALDGGTDGLDIIRKLLTQARDRLTPDGIVMIEVGGLQKAMERAFGNLGLHWLHTADGSDCVCVIQAHRLLS